MESEIHLIILWERARHQEKRILEDIKKRFKIIETYEIEWTPELVPDNFTRFYGVKLPQNSFKEKECGRGKFLLIIIRDSHPNYQERETSHGKEMVNANLFDNKTIYRRWTRGGHKVHATNSVIESNHDLTLLLGVNYEDFDKQHVDREWDGKIKELKRNITGAEGWKNLDDFFYVLNNTIHYVVLRGAENLSPNKNNNHEDVDLLVEEWQDAIYVMNAEKTCFSSPFRPKLLVHTELEGDFLFDLWMSTMSYHSNSWHESMFKSKVFTGLYYKLNPENDFYSLIYHCLVNKNKVADDYIPRLTHYFHFFDLNKKYNVQSYVFPLDMYYHILQDFMTEKGYEFVSAKDDYHCFFNKRIANIKPAWDKLLEKGVFNNILPCRVTELSTSGYIYFTGEYQQKRTFIKFGGVGDSCINEINCITRLCITNQRNFLKPLCYSKEADCKYIAFDYDEGMDLSQFMSSATELQKKEISIQLSEISKSLAESHIMHRDITPQNLIMYGENLTLVDFQYALDAVKPKELRCVREDRRLAVQIGDKYRYGNYKWNDYYSLQKIAEQYHLNVEIAPELNMTIRMPMGVVMTIIARKYLKEILSNCMKIKNRIWLA